jgi:hypothetical protein
MELCQGPGQRFDELAQAPQFLERIASPFGPPGLSGPATTGNGEPKSLRIIDVPAWWQNAGPALGSFLDEREPTGKIVPAQPVDAPDLAILRRDDDRGFRPGQPLPLPVAESFSVGKQWAGFGDLNRAWRRQVGVAEVAELDIQRFAAAFGTDNGHKVFRSIRERVVIVGQFDFYLESSHFFLANRSHICSFVRRLCISALP